MPVGPEHLSNRWQNDDNALKQLGRNFLVEGGWIKPLRETYKPTMRDLSAIAYLVMEWDYAYSDTDMKLDLAQFEDHMDISYAGELKTLTVGENDVLVCKLNFAPSQDLFEQLRKGMETQFPNLKARFILIGKDFDFFVIKGSE